MKTVKTGKSYIRPSIVAAAIIALVFSHFAVSQFIFIENEKDSVVTEMINKQAVEIKTEFETKKSDIVVSPKRAVPVSPVSERETEKIVPRQSVIKQPVIKKREALRESKTERLRRAEKLLTGV